MPSLRGTDPGSTMFTATRTPRPSFRSSFQGLAQAGGVAIERAGLALEGELVHQARALDDQSPVGGDAGDAGENLLDVRGIHVDAADDQHVVAAAAELDEARGGAPAGARLVGDRAEIAGPVADQRERLLGQGGEHQLADGSGRDGRAVVRIDRLDQEMVLVDVQPVARGEALGRDPGSAHLRQAVEVDRLDPERAIDLHAQALGPRLAAEQAQLERAGGRIDALIGQLLGDHQRVGGRRDEHLRAEVAQQLRLARRAPARDRHHRGADPLAALVKAETAREQAVAVGVVDHHAGRDAGHRHAARHQIGPRVEVRARVPDHRRPAVGSARGVQAHELLPGHREQPERVVLPQVALGGERDPRQVIERLQIVGRDDPRVMKPLGAERLAVQNPGDGVAQARELEAL